MSFFHTTLSTRPHTRTLTMAGDRVYPQLTRDEVAELITLGHVLVLHRRKIYRVNSWLRKHPGGHLALLHFVGRDAANEIDAYHSHKTMDGLMRSFLVAEVAEKDWSERAGWKPLVPLIQAGEAGQWGRIEDYADVKRSWRADLEAIRLCASSKGADETSDVKAQLDKRRFTSVETIEPPSPPPSIDPEAQFRISKAWEVLHRRLEDEGYYEAKPLSNYKTEVLRYFGLFAAFLYVFYHAKQTCR